MNSKALIVNNPSAYWMDFEGEKLVYYFMEWTNPGVIRHFRGQEIDFVSRYMAFARRYKIAVPLFTGDRQELLDRYEAYSISRKEKGSSPLNMLYYVYEYHNKLVYPSLLFTGENFQDIISLDPFLTTNDIDSIAHLNSPPVRVQINILDSKISLDVYIDNDIFFSEVDNRIVKRDEEIGGKRCWVDNRVTARLNVPRLNSFLRDLKALCVEFGANEFSFENTLDADPDNPDYFTEEGVKIDGKFYYFEDIKNDLEKNNFPFSGEA